MSRAVDAGVKALVENGNHEAVYQCIAQVLSQRIPDKLLEIELLAASYPIDADTIFLQDDACIAIPKARLVQAFVCARQILMRYLDSERIPSSADGFPEGVLSAAGVMLLMDPEHLTAANTRKRLLLGFDARESGPEYVERLESERYFIDSLLTSRLHRHTKSPTLWHHRRWLMERFRERDMDWAVVDSIKTVVLVAAERHPRNYYAWGHARYLVEEPSPSSQVMGDILGAVKQWALSHHDDVSGWAFLMFLLGKVPGHAEPVVAETLALAGSFGWRNESVWYFLRNMVRQHAAVMESQWTVFRATGTALLGRRDGQDDDDDDDMGRRVLNRALRWIET